MRNFRELNIWKQGIELVKQIYELVKDFPKEEKYGLQSQITRAVVSVPSNIAEGCSRNSDIEYKRFLEIAMGSLFELETQLIILEETDMISNDRLKVIHETIAIEARMINSLINKIKQTNSQKPKANN